MTWEQETSKAAAVSCAGEYDQANGHAPEAGTTHGGVVLIITGLWPLDAERQDAGWEEERLS
jgi:hypothetical protein